MHEKVLLHGRSHSARSFHAFHHTWMIPHISQSFKDQVNAMPFLYVFAPDFANECTHTCGGTQRKPEADIVGFARLSRRGSKGVSPKTQNWLVFNGDISAQGWFAE
ncbi:MAG: hypothetical protein WCA27_25925 [Candidatus Sulfotelmatobacter sp.]